MHGGTTTKMENELKKVIVENLPDLNDFRQKQYQWLDNNEVNSWELPMSKSKEFEGVFKTSEGLDLKIGKYEVPGAKFLGGYGAWSPRVYLGPSYIDHGCYRYPCMRDSNERLWLLERDRSNKLNLFYLENRVTDSEKIIRGLKVDEVIGHIAKNAEPSEKHWETKLRLLVESLLEVEANGK